MTKGFYRTGGGFINITEAGRGFAGTPTCIPKTCSDGKTNVGDYHSHVRNGIHEVSDSDKKATEHWRDKECLNFQSCVYDPDGGDDPFIYC